MQQHPLALFFELAIFGEYFSKSFYVLKIKSMTIPRTKFLDLQFVFYR